ncbi:DUF1707 SHOCT-like domain-containing protein [Gaopeijia maritima]|uniref:DUF1707 domain-containing protein n=1 Tax=Gaopeijia maritima TaxID=3119007 RepID=A0ABU9E4Q9_9BACT
MSEDERSDTPAGEADRQRAVDALCQAFADDRIEVDEFERRVELAHRAQTAEELRRLLAGVPGAAPPVPHASAGGAPAPGSTALAAARPAGDHPLQPVESVRPTSFIAGILGGGSRAGAWYPARINYAMGVMGGFSLDLREAPLPPGVTEIKLFCMWGGGEIIVPPDVRVEVSIAGILGGFDYDHAAPSTLDPSAPVVRVSGICFMGGAEIAVRYAGETSGDARRRRRHEKKERRRALKAARKQGD